MEIETIKFGEFFYLLFSEMNIQIIPVGKAEKVIIFKTDIFIEQETLDGEIFEPEYNMTTTLDILPQENMTQIALKSTAKILNEANKLLDFIWDNKKNFLEKVTVHEIYDKH
ncbi:hypothetical protein [Lactococcus fujiensis]|uniref:Uncharacterized protein n=1 Tax=Lactococcus fujiensis JCM 16395 TaxID=1291764 RepID=A0A2A5RHX8_9LACT|nr:hypothetical protein [Lactococcus fujiensis]PCR98655.1 hypothetical protein RT41_GL001395 [Lactococcus fujiensis JCM 16395]